MWTEDSSIYRDRTEYSYTGQMGQFFIFVIFVGCQISKKGL